MRKIVGAVLLLAMISCQKKSTQEKLILTLDHKDIISLNQELLSITKIRDDVACIPESLVECGEIETIQYPLESLPATIDVTSLEFSEKSHSFPTYLVLTLPNGYQFEGVNHTSMGKKNFLVLQEIGGHVYSTDGSDLYCKQRLVEQKIPLENIQYSYGYNDDHVWFNCEETNLNLETSSIEVLGWNFLKDENSVVFTNKLLKGADPESFELLSNYYQRDKLKAYYQGAVLEDIDSINF
ncbi:MAG: DKNYY domain-containing protein [Pseudobacteriovorax sp.]|nr:DKNYY domain-containing protein [Pseudobacteriovorax sp.]